MNFMVCELYPNEVVFLKICKDTEIIRKVVKIKQHISTFKGRSGNSPWSYRRITRGKNRFYISHNKNRQIATCN